MPNGTAYRIVLTGGPGGGKTTAADMFRRELAKAVIVVPESATLLFKGGFPRTEERYAQYAAQRAIFHVQRNLEDVQSARFPDRVLLCDRGTVDGAAYWPGQPEDYFQELGTSLEKELARYDAVLFFESAALAGSSVIEDGNPVRSEGILEAAALDAKLRVLWSNHPRFHVVPHAASFLDKIARGLTLLNQLLRERVPPNA